jgi:fructokinase
LGTLINKLVKKSDPQDAIDYACAIGALVASYESCQSKVEK